MPENIERPSFGKWIIGLPTLALAAVIYLAGAKMIRPDVLWLLVCGALALAPIGFLVHFLEWKIAARKKTATEPNLLGEVAGFMVFAPGELDKQPAVAITLSISNLGDPSWAGKYAVSITTQGEQRQVELFVTDPLAKATSHMKLRGYVSPGMDRPLSLYTSPISRGETLTGYLLARVGGYTPDDVRDCVFVVEFFDVLGKRYVVTGSRATMRHLT